MELSKGGVIVKKSGGRRRGEKRMHPSSMNYILT